MNDDKSALLGRLKIDRTIEPEPASGIGKWILIGAGALILIGGVVYALRPAPAVPVKVASAISLATAPTAGSVLDASGYVVARRAATVSSKVTGKVTEILIEEGKAVKAGDVLARLDDSNARAQSQLSASQLDAAKANLNEIRVQLKDAQRQYQRAQELHERKLVSDAALDTAQASAEGLAARLDSAQQNVVVSERALALYNRQVDDTVVRAPFSGMITVKNAQVGEMISPLSAGGAGTRTGIGTLVDMDSLEIEVDVNENFINRVTPGQRVEGVLNAYPDWKIPSSVIAVIPTADRSKATVKVRIKIEAKDARVLPDMGVRVSFLPDEKPADPKAAAPAGVLIPSEAVKDENGTKVVFLVREDKVERRAVSIGTTRGSQVNVLAGVSPGDKVAVGDLAKLADGTKIEIQP